MNSPVTNPTTSAATAPADTVMMSVSRLNSTTLASTLGFSASTRPPPAPPRLLGPLLCRVSAASSRATAAPGLSWLMTVPSLALVAGGVAGAGWAPGYMHNGRGRLLRDTGTSYEDLLAQVGAEH